MREFSLEFYTQSTNTTTTLLNTKSATSSYIIQTETQQWQINAKKQSFLTKESLQ